MHEQCVVKTSRLYAGHNHNCKYSRAEEGVDEVHTAYAGVQLILQSPQQRLHVVVVREQLHL